MSDDAKKSVTVRIAGEEHVIRSSADPEYTKACARHVDEHIAEVRESAGLIEQHKAAILAALAVTDEYFQARAGLTRLQRQLTARADVLASKLQKELNAED